MIIQLDIGGSKVLKKIDLYSLVWLYSHTKYLGKRCNTHGKVPSKHGCETDLKTGWVCVLGADYFHATCKYAQN